MCATLCLARFPPFREVHFLPKWTLLHLIHCLTGRSSCAKQTRERTKERQSSIMPPPPPPYFLPSLAFSIPSSPATFICCSINNCYCSFNHAPVISKSGGHVSSPSHGSLGNYQHPSKGQCSCSSVAVAIITLPPITSVPWARSPSGLSLSRHAFLC